jgi:small subunit ribosomal protein S2
VIALIDTDSDPKDIAICIPCNDDSIRSVQVVLAHLVEAIVEGWNLAKALASDKAPAAPAPRPQPRPEAKPAPAPAAAPSAPGPTPAS